MLTEEILHSIDDGSHGDPFSVLGPHITDVEGKKKLIIRVFRPDAKEVALIISPKTRHVMTRLSEGGLFEYIFPRRKKIPEYRLAVPPFQGQAYSIDDPYRFEPAQSLIKTSRSQIQCYGLLLKRKLVGYGS